MPSRQQKSAQNRPKVSEVFGIKVIKGNNGI